MAVQVEVHCHWRNDRTIDWCRDAGIHVTAYAPLSSPQTMHQEGKDVPNLLKVIQRLPGAILLCLICSAMRDISQEYAVAQIHFDNASVMSYPH